MSRSDWPRARLDAHRLAALRSLLAVARTRSPWHARRLRGIDLERLTLEDLAELPPMTKEDLRTGFDELVTDRALTRARCRQHLQEIEASRKLYLDGRYVVTSTGGSTGEPTLIVADRRDIARDARALARMIQRWSSRAGVLPAGVTLAVVTSASPRYRSQHLYRFLPTLATHFVSVFQPTEAIVAGLNRAHPNVLLVYPSLLPRLAHEAAAGRLAIRPELVLGGAEPLLPEHVAAVARAWGCPVIEGWGTSETGLLALGSGFEPGMLVLEDSVIVEPVNRGGAPARPGELAEKVYVTPLFRRTLPLLRYELTDQVVLYTSPSACGSSFSRIRVEGRAEDAFCYPGGVTIRPYLFRGILGTEPAVLEYQVEQTGTGVDVRVTTAGEVDVERLRRKLEEGLSSAGLPHPAVELRQVERIERNGATGKLRQLVPLPSAQLGGNLPDRRPAAQFSSQHEET